MNNVFWSQEQPQTTDDVSVDCACCFCDDATSTVCCVQRWDYWALFSNYTRTGYANICDACLETRSTTYHQQWFPTAGYHLEKQPVELAQAARQAAARALGPSRAIFWCLDRPDTHDGKGIPPDRVCCFCGTATDSAWVVHVRYLTVFSHDGIASTCSQCLHERTAGYHRKWIKPIGYRLTEIYPEEAKEIEYTTRQ